MRDSFVIRKLAIVGCTLLLTTSSPAGWSTRRVTEATSSVPISTLSQVDLAMSGGQTIDSLKNLPPAVLSPATRTTLRGLSAFTGLTDPQIDTQFNAINTLTVESIEVLRGPEPALGSALLGMYVNQRIGIGVSGVSGVVNLIAETRHDGSARVADDAINFYWVPKLPPAATRFELYEPDGFQFVNILARQGCQAALEGYLGRQPQNLADDALYHQALYGQAVACGQLEVQRITETIVVMDGISTNLDLPEISSGFAAGIGRRLLWDDSLTDQEKRDAANQLRGYLAGSALPLAGQQLEYTELAVAVAGLVLDGRFPGIESANEPVKMTGPWSHALVPTMGEFNRVTVFGGGGSLDLMDPQNPLVRGDNHFWQIGGRADGTTAPEEFTIEDVDYLVGASRWDNKLLVAGYSLDSFSTKFYGYADTDGDGRVESGTRQLVIDTPLFETGLHLEWNKGRDELYALDLGTRGLYHLGMFDGSGFPTDLTQRGGLGDQYPGVTKLSFSADGNWAIGHLDYGLALQPHAFALEARFSATAGEFRPVRKSFRYEEIDQQPAAAETAWSGSLGLRVTSTPNEVVAAEKWTGGAWSELGTAQTDPYGRAIVELSEPFAAGGRYRFSSVDRTAFSPTYVVPPDVAGPWFVDPKLRRDMWLRAATVFEPESDIKVEWKAGLDLPWSPGGTKTTPMLGTVDHKIDITGTTAAVMRAEALEKPPVLRPDYFAIPPVAVYALYPGWNDYFRYGALFAASRAQDVSNPYLAVPGMGSLTSRLLMYANRNGLISYEYKVSQGIYTGLLNTLVVVPEIVKAIWPPVELNELGEEVVYIKCLILGGYEYPVFQFAMRPPDNCLFIHWHSPSFQFVYHLDFDFAGISDPDPSFCGYGTIYEVPVETVEVALDDWLDYLDARLPSGFSAARVPSLNDANDPLCRPVGSTPVTR